jgi:hypothetical protein
MRTRDAAYRPGTHRLIDGFDPELAPPWWAYEGEVKRRVALEVTLRRLFRQMPGCAPGVKGRRARRSRQG